MHVLIIGGTRFLGAAIARELLRGDHAVTVLHRGQTPGDLPDAVTHILGDARDRSLIESTLRTTRYDAVVDTILQADDLAWYLPLLQQHSGQLVHCGSTGVYAPAAHVPVTEDDPCPCPEHLGGFGSKLDQDRAVVRFHRDTGFKTCSLRISNVFGPGDVPLDVWGGRNPKYFQRVADGGDVWLPERGAPLLQPVHIDDLARGFCAALETDAAAGQIYNLSSERAVTLAHYHDLVADLLGTTPPVRHVTIQDILDKNDIPYSSGLYFVCEHMSIDWSKARRELGYVPQISVREGLRQCLQWMVDTGTLRATVDS
jgi:nucleoside-diphosphate-sugar epimerase